MIGIILVVTACLLFYMHFRKWSYKKKLAFKMLLANLLLLFTAFSVFAAVFSVKETAEYRKDSSLSNRLENTMYFENDMERFAWYGGYMAMCQNYEEDFEYIWERLCMYNESHRYRLFEAAMNRAEAEGRAEELRLYETRVQESGRRLERLCESHVYEENRPYAKIFLEQTRENVEIR